MCCVLLVCLTKNERKLYFDVNYAGFSCTWWNAANYYIIKVKYNSFFSSESWNAALDVSIDINSIHGMKWMV